MDRKPEDSLREKLMNSKDKAEKQNADAAAGVRELDPDMLEGISGGNQAIPPEWFMKDE